MKRFLAVLVIAAAGAAQPVIACDQQEAVDMMVKLTTALGQKAGAAATAEESQAIVDANGRVNEAGAALAAGDPEKACEIYRQVAAEQGISL
jgi:hypothetical protein